MSKVKNLGVPQLRHKLAALLVDGGLLVLICMMLGEVLASSFVQMGAWGPLVGIMLALLYVAFMNSELSRWETVGHRCFALRVVDCRGAPISFTCSLYRSATIACPAVVLVFVAVMEEALGHNIFASWLFIMAWTVLGVNGYLWCFNRDNAQTLSDLAASTYLINTRMSQPGIPLNSKHQWLALPFILAAVIVAEDFRGANNRFALDRQSDAITHTLAQSTSIHSTSLIYREDAEAGWRITAKVKLHDAAVNNSQCAQRVAQFIAHHLSSYVHSSPIEVHLVYMFDIGFWSKSMSATYRVEVADLLPDSPSTLLPELDRQCSL